MTKKRDPKNLVPDRQAGTGEPYIAALRHVGSPRTGAVKVIEFVDISDMGAALGFKCRTLVSPKLAERVDTTTMLVRLRDVLLATTRDQAFALMRSTVLYGEHPFASQASLEQVMRFRARVRAGIGGICDSGRMLSFSIAGRTAPELVLFALWLTPVRYIDIPPRLIITSAEFSLGEPELGWEVLRPTLYPTEEP